MLFRISRHASGEPYFGRNATNRFDDSHKQPGKRYGTCDCGFDLETAIAETILHDEEPKAGIFRLAATEFTTRHLVQFKRREELVVADLTGSWLKRLGGTSAISAIVPYELPQRWSRAIHKHPQLVDGIFYMSRHLNDRPALVIFDRAGSQAGIRLVHAPGRRAWHRQGSSEPWDRDRRALICSSTCCIR